MDKQPFFLRNEQVRSNCQAFIQGLPTDDKKPLVVKIQPITRSLEQNSKLHALLSDISKQCEFNGKKRDIDTWKIIMVSAHKIATGGQAEMVIGLEGEVINLRESTAQMSVKRLASLIEYITCWGAQNGVRFNDRWGFK
ncbi:recombination protein NinB [Haemophilus influenzae]|uniref:NinB protein n=1 Tax=Haemophilus influenzae TaxID=727 RepID=A0A2S9RPB1_HAEIF|nr:recombination protein NinB [Haemophilus influenzae]PRI42845.1 NinB protein [Haemophilus influenzae]PRI85150.1 NinB protein [Haemophilus influenzae]PRI90827.1 NinB protein [Haemophilus influenzae]PRJ59899.1 NinB protein [Haemophilus influenzae]PRJ83749.1 NinB protein [Haemophilus influenzae]